MYGHKTSRIHRETQLSCRRSKWKSQIPPLLPHTHTHESPSWIEFPPRVQTGNKYKPIAKIYDIDKNAWRQAIVPGTKMKSLSYLVTVNHLSLSWYGARAKYDSIYRLSAMRYSWNLSYSCWGLGRDKDEWLFWFKIFCFTVATLISMTTEGLKSKCLVLFYLRQFTIWNKRFRPVLIKLSSFT